MFGQNLNLVCVLHEHYRSGRPWSPEKSQCMGTEFHFEISVLQAERNWFLKKDLNKKIFI